MPAALERFSSVLLLTHVPPFRKACWYKGRISDDDFLPHFCCSVVGEVLERIMREHPDHTLTVLCGHTHGKGKAAIFPNLRVKTAGAKYGKPRLQDPVKVG